jgi:hypothetical protein
MFFSKERRIREAGSGEHVGREDVGSIISDVERMLA